MNSAANVVPELCAPRHADHLDPEAATRAWVPTAAVLAAADVAVAVVAALVFAGPQLANDVAFGAMAGAIAALVQLGAGAYRYDAWRRTQALARLARLIFVATLGVWSATVLFDLMAQPHDRHAATFVWALLPLAWFVTHAAVAGCRRRERVLVLGSGEVADRICQSVLVQGDFLLGCVDDRLLPFELPDVPWLGRIADLPELVSNLSVDRVIVAYSRTRDREIVETLRRCDGLPVRIDLIPRLFELVGDPLNTNFAPLPLADASARTPGRIARAAKRTVDIAGAAVLVVAFAPVFVLVASLIVVVDGRPVFFRQERIGRGGRPLTIRKFRTMRNTTGADGELERLLTAEPSVAAAVATAKRNGRRRTTGLGVWLRRSSLDELPQLFNVLAGEMSLVGPRPLRREEVGALSKWQARRLDVPPGLTGSWQVLRQPETGWDERMELDYKYVRSWSLATDLELVARTVPAVIRGRGAV